jgi:hypothetical protein
VRDTLHEVARRILRAFVEQAGHPSAVLSTDLLDSAAGIDITYLTGGARIRVKVKADSYFGTDPGKIADRSLTYYRPTADAYSFETVADAQTRESGWLHRSQAEELMYYRLAIAQPPDEITQLLGGSDDDLIGGLAVERDDLTVFQVPDLREWFEANADKYPARPVFGEGKTGWCRIIPAKDIHDAVKGTRFVGPVVDSLRRD